MTGITSASQVLHHSSMTIFGQNLQLHLLQLVARLEESSASIIDCLDVWRSVSRHLSSKVLVAKLIVLMRIWDRVCSGCIILLAGTMSTYCNSCGKCVFALGRFRSFIPLRNSLSLCCNRSSLSAIL